MPLAKVFYRTEPVGRTMAVELNYGDALHALWRYTDSGFRLNELLDAFENLGVDPGELPAGSLQNGLVALQQARLGNRKLSDYERTLQTASSHLLAATRSVTGRFKGTALVCLAFCYKELGNESAATAALTALRDYRFRTPLLERLRLHWKCLPGVVIETLVPGEGETDMGIRFRTTNDERVLAALVEFARITVAAEQ